jgi:hypothetical protein
MVKPFRLWLKSSVEMSFDWVRCEKSLTSLTEKIGTA